jgi:hypothetical protein
MKDKRKYNGIKDSDTKKQKTESPNVLKKVKTTKSTKKSRPPISQPIHQSTSESRQPINEICSIEKIHIKPCDDPNCILVKTFGNIYHKHLPGSNYHTIINQPKCDLSQWHYGLCNNYNCPLNSVSNILHAPNLLEQIRKSSINQLTSFQKSKPIVIEKYDPKQDIEYVNIVDETEKVVDLSTEWPKLNEKLFEELDTTEPEFFPWFVPKKEDSTNYDFEMLWKKELKKIKK